MPAGWTPSELRALLDLDAEDPGPEIEPTLEPAWRCLQCHSARWTETGPTSYVCSECMGTEFYNALHPAKHQTTDGKWIFAPRSVDAPVDEPLSPPFRSQLDSRRPDGDLSPPGSRSTREAAENEHPTDDPKVAIRPRIGADHEFKTTSKEKSDLRALS